MEFEKIWEKRYNDCFNSRENLYVHTNISYICTYILTYGIYFAAYTRKCLFFI